MHDFGSLLTPKLGGPVQKLNRLGSRFYLDVTLPPMMPDTARPWLAALIRAQASGAIMPFPQLDFDVGNPGNAVMVNGGGQVGATLLMDGFTPGYVVHPGQFFSVTHSGRIYLHMFTTQVVANTSGALSASLAPMLRIIPSDNDPISVAVPKIEGFLEGDDRSWDLTSARHFGLQFRITESE